MLRKNALAVVILLLGSGRMAPATTPDPCAQGILIERLGELTSLSSALNALKGVPGTDKARKILEHSFSVAISGTYTLVAGGVRVSSGQVPNLMEGVRRAKEYARASLSSDLGDRAEFILTILTQPSKP